MSNEVQPQKADVYGTGPARKPGVKQRYSSYYGPAERNAATGASADCPRNSDETHPPSPFPNWEGVDILDNDTPGGGCFAALPGATFPCPYGAAICGAARGQNRTGVAAKCRATRGGNGTGVAAKSGFFILAPSGLHSAALRGVEVNLGGIRIRLPRAAASGGLTHGCTSVRLRHCNIQTIKL